MHTLLRALCTTHSSVCATMPQCAAVHVLHRCMCDCTCSTLYAPLRYVILQRARVLHTLQYSTCYTRRSVCRDCRATTSGYIATFCVLWYTKRLQTNRHQPGARHTLPALILPCRYRAKCAAIYAARETHSPQPGAKNHCFFGGFTPGCGEHVLKTSSF